MTDKGINPSRGHCNYKTLNEQVQVHLVHETNANRFKVTANTNTVIVDDFHTLFLPIGNSYRQNVNRETFKM